MLTWLKSLRRRWGERRAARQATVGERTLRENEAKAQRLRHERMHNSGGGPKGGPGI